MNLGYLKRSLKNSHYNLQFVRHCCDVKGFKDQILQETCCSTSHLTPELKLHLITPNCRLWKSTDSLPFRDPFWGFYWPGGQAISRYVLDNPSISENKSVLDFGCGCGACGLSAKKNRAKKVVFNDIDKVAITAVELNAHQNSLVVDESSCRNLIGTDCLGLDLILVGDMFYDAEFTDEILQWLMKMSSDGKSVLIGDPGRFAIASHPMKHLLKCVAKYRLFSEAILENNGHADTFVWTFR